MLKVSIITTVLNGADTIRACIRSIQSQTLTVEHIIIDGGSTDGTMNIIKEHKDKIAKVVSEPDKGIYDALNKGIKLAKGEIIGFLHSDDFYAHDRVIGKVADVFVQYNVDSCYGDLKYVDKNNPGRVIRYWKSSRYSYGKFKYGWMPPHPTFFVKKEIYEKHGYFNIDFKISADYELMLRFLQRYSISTYYISDVLVNMRLGGKSNRNIKNMFIKSSEDYKAWKVNDLNGGFYTILLKNLSKMPQFLKRV